MSSAEHQSDQSQLVGDVCIGMEDEEGDVGLWREGQLSRSESQTWESGSLDRHCIALMTLHLPLVFSGLFCLLLFN